MSASTPLLTLPLAPSEPPPARHAVSWRQRLLRSPWLMVVGPAVVLLAWWGASSSGWAPEQLLVSPLDVVRTFGELVARGELQEHLARSFQRLGLGYAAGAVVGLAFGVALGLSKGLQAYASGLFHAVRQVPSIAFIPMFILLFGIEETFKVVIVAKAAFFPVALATLDAVNGIPRSYFDVARVLRLPTPDVVRRVVLPATIPPVLTGMRLALSRSWMVLVAAELVAAESGIGQMMEMGRQMMRMDVVMVGVLTVGVIGFGLDWGFKTLERRLVRWRTS